MPHLLGCELDGPLHLAEFRNERVAAYHREVSDMLLAVAVNGGPAKASASVPAGRARSGPIFHIGDTLKQARPCVSRV
jgi:hypothetical protein